MLRYVENEAFAIKVDAHRPSIHPFSAILKTRPHLTVRKQDEILINDEMFKCLLKRNKTSMSPFKSEL